jgi:hypothetical protein
MFCRDEACGNSFSKPEGVKEYIQGEAHACVELGWIETDGDVPKEINHLTPEAASEECFSLFGGILRSVFSSTEANCRGTRTSSK